MAAGRQDLPPALTAAPAHAAAPDGHGNGRYRADPRWPAELDRQPTPAPDQRWGGGRGNVTSAGSR